MPYSGPDDDKLPSNVQKMDEGARRKWAATWNSVHADCMKKGGEDCEGKAFRVANGTASKEETEEAGGEEQGNAVGVLRHIVDGLMSRLGRGKAVNPTPAPAWRGGFIITKATDGSLRWLGIPSNRWRDRDNPPQIISEAAHREFVAHLEHTKEYPELWAWHTPGTRLGVADFAEYSNGFLIMGGPIDRGMEAAAERLAAKCRSEDIGMSHGFLFRFSDEPNQIIGWYRTREVSHLPRDKAANLWTSMDVLGSEVKAMSMTPERRKYLEGVYGASVVAGLEANLEKFEKDLTTAGVEFKAAPAGSKEMDMCCHGCQGCKGSPVGEACAGCAGCAGMDMDKALKGSPATPGHAAAATASADVATLKAVTDGLSKLGEAIAALSGQIASVKSTADEAKKAADEAKGQAAKSADELIAEAFKTGAQAGYRASKQAPGPTDADKKAIESLSLNAPTGLADAGLVSLMFGAQQQPMK